MDRMEGNYKKQVEMARGLFLQWDAGEIARRFDLEADGDFLYVNFFHQRHRVGRRDGVIQRQLPSGWREAGFNAHLSIFDAICREKRGTLRGQWCTINNLGNLHHPGVGENSLYAPYERAFDRRAEDLRRACGEMGGEPFPVGDAGAVLPVFDFMPLVFQFWEGDEEFPPQIRLLWDFNTLDFVRYETAWYIALYGLDRLKTLAGA